MATTNDDGQVLGLPFSEIKRPLLGRIGETAELTRFPPTANQAKKGGGATSIYFDG